VRGGHSKKSKLGGTIYLHTWRTSVITVLTEADEGRTPGNNKPRETTMKIETYRSSGSDGYTPGTWGVVVTLPSGRTVKDGGWHCESHARAEGRRMAKRFS
jgi:hypothetical protein